LPLNFLETYQKNVEAVNAKDIKTAFSHRLDPNKMALVVVGTPLE
jgi:zinc protease